MPASSPSTTLYTLGRGVLKIAPWSGATPPSAGAYVDVGNASKFDVEISEEELDHYSSRTGLKTLDKSVTLQAGYTATFDLDEVSVANMAKFLRGTLEGNVIHALTALTKEYGLIFTTDNPAGENQTWELWRSKLTPGGAFSLIGDDWSKMSFMAKGLADVSNHAATPYFDVTWVTTTTTTTTTSV